MRMCRCLRSYQDEYTAYHAHYFYKILRSYSFLEEDFLEIFIPAQGSRIVPALDFIEINASGSLREIYDHESDDGYQEAA